MMVICTVGTFLTLVLIYYILNIMYECGKSRAIHSVSVFTFTHIVSFTT